jgi:predicted  nucleic acid-binding Zn-ribbon protein
LNPKIQKISDDIEKLRRKISSAQNRLRDLERQKVELENADIVAAVRGIDVPPEELHTLIARLQSQSVPHFEPREDEFEN